MKLQEAVKSSSAPALKRTGWRLLGQLLVPLARLVALSGGLALVAALMWRGAGIAPDAVWMLDGASLVLWLGMLALEPALWQARAAQHGLVRIQPPPPSSMVRLALSLLFCCIMSALAFVPLLLAYNSGSPVAQVLLFGAETYTLRAGVWLLGALLLAGPAVAAWSLATLSAMRRLAGEPAGTALWLVAGLAAHYPLVAGVRTSGPWLSIGQYADRIASFLARAHEQYLFTSDIWPQVAGYPLAALAAGLVLLMLIPHRTAQWSQPLPAGWLAAVGGMVAAAGYTALQLMRWLGNPGLLHPGTAEQLIGRMLGGFLVVYLALALFAPCRVPRASWGQVGWLAMALVATGWAAAPLVVSGQVARPELLWLGMAALPAAGVGMLVVNLAARQGVRMRTGQAPWLVALLALLLVVPWPAAGSTVAPLIAGWLVLSELPGSMAPAIAWTIAVGSLCVVLIGWWWLARNYNPPGNRRV